MPDQRDIDRRNDGKFFTPLLLMATLLACGIVIYVYTGHPLTGSG